MSDGPKTPLEYRAVGDDRRANRSVGGRFVGGAAAGAALAFVADMVLFAAVVVPANEISYRRARIALRWCGVAFAAEAVVALGLWLVLWRARNERPFHAGLATGVAIVASMLTLWAFAD